MKINKTTAKNIQKILNKKILPILRNKILEQEIISAINLEQMLYEIGRNNILEVYTNLIITLIAHKKTQVMDEILDTIKDIKQ